MIILAFAVILGLLINGILQLRGRTVLNTQGYWQKMTPMRAGGRVLMPSAGVGLASMTIIWALVFGFNLNNQMASNPRIVDNFIQATAALTPPVVIIGMPFSFELSPIELDVSVFVMALVMFWKELVDYENALTVF